jgi:glycosyltransferase involved in cell wall biosynthesis
VNPSVSGPIAVAYRSSVAPGLAWSGIPQGLAKGLDELGVSAALVNADLPAVWRAASQAWAIGVRDGRRGGLCTPEIYRARSWTLNRKLRGLRPLSGLVQMGSDFGVPRDKPCVTFDDMTVPQARALPSPWGLGLTERAVGEWQKAQKQCLDEASACCVASHWVADSLKADYRIPADKVHIVGFGRNLTPRPVSREWDVPRFLFVGYQWERKNGPRVVRAFTELRRYFAAATLDVVGQHPRIDGEGVRGHGTLNMNTGDGRKRLEQLFEQATVFVLPSIFEPFGIVYTEAAAAGIPSIGTCVGGAAEAIGEGGMLVRPDDTCELFRAMMTLAEPARCRELGIAAQRRAEFFTWRAVAGRIVRALGLSSRFSEGLPLFL